MAQLKTLLLIAALFIVSSFAISPCSKPGYKQPADCMVKAVDPAFGNCWWGYDTTSCIEIYATSATQCSDYCNKCLTCVYNYGCCKEGLSTLYSTCYSNCVANI